MKKTIQVLVIAVALFQLSGFPVLALDVIVGNNGSVYFYESRVLGDETEEPEKEVEKKDEKQESTKPQETQKPESEKRKDEKKQNQEKQKEIEKRREATQPVKIFSPEKNTKVRVSTDKEKNTILIEKKQEGKSLPEASGRPVFSTTQSVTTDELRLELPSRRQGELEEKETETETNDATKETEDRRKGSSESGKPRTEREQEARKKTIEERNKRVGEKIEIQSEVHDDGQTEFQFESRNVRATLKGSEFTINPTTNGITVTTPAGQTHELIHLPDQALERMKEAGLLGDQVATSSAKIQIETKDDGSVVYQTQIEKTKRIFGLFPRQVETTVELNDATGQVTETQVQPTNIVDRFLNFLAR